MFVCKIIILKKNLSFILYSLGLFNIGVFYNKNVEKDQYIVLILLTLYFLIHYLNSNRREKQNIESEEQ